MLRTEICENAHTWNEFVLENGGHPLQLWGWGELKNKHNWQARRIVVYRGKERIGGAQLLVRQLPKPFNQLLYIPRGPIIIGDNGKDVYKELAAYAKQEYKGVVLTVEPDSDRAPIGKGWKKSGNTILVPRTIVLDLSHTKEELQSRMTKKTRQYIRKSEKSGLCVKRVETEQGIGDCLTIYKQTAARAQFNLHNDEYYHDLHQAMGEHSVVYGCYEGEKLVSFLWLAVSNEVAFELYGGMSERGQELRANYTLKWETICKMKQWGVSWYDMNGLLNDGVSSFKMGFADHTNELAGTYDYVLSPLYAVWSKGLPAAKKIVRKAKKIIR